METDRPARSVLFVRCPDALRQRLAAAAKQGLRSLNNEVIYRLQQSLKNTTSADPANNPSGEPLARV
jgi:hypothetical protein